MPSGGTPIARRTLSAAAPQDGRPIGPPGPTGAAFSNVESSATIANGGSISGTDTTLLFYVNNSGGPVSVTLPLASTLAGKMIRVQGTAIATGSNGVTVNTQGGNLIFGGEDG